MVMTLKDIKARLRAGPYAWPGGYPKYFVMADGEAMSFEAVKSAWKEVCRSHLRPNDRWSWDFLVAGCEINWEDAELICCHTNKRIESAYAEDNA